MAHKKIDTLVRAQRTAIEDLRDVQRQMEEMYISSKGPNLRVLSIDEADEDVWKG